MTRARDPVAVIGVGWDDGDPPHDRDRVIRNNDRVIAVPSALLAAELTRAGAGDVGISTRRRAEYSSDASNYRVVPGAGAAILVLCKLS